MAEKSTSQKSEKAHIHITGMTCTTCAATIEKGLAETPGVEQALSSVLGVISANVNLASEKATVEYIEGTELAMNSGQKQRRWKVRSFCWVT